MVSPGNRWSLHGFKRTSKMKIWLKLICQKKMPNEMQIQTWKGNQLVSFSMQRKWKMFHSKTKTEGKRGRWRRCHWKFFFITFSQTNVGIVTSWYALPFLFVTVLGKKGIVTKYIVDLGVPMYTQRTFH
jgi:hypothetical protein